MIQRIARPLLLCALLLAAALASPGRAAAQTDTVAAAADTVYEVRLTDGSVLYGRVTAQTEESVTLQTEAGAVVTVRRGQIVSMQPLRGRVVAGRVWPDDPNATRLFFGPTGRAVGAGRGYLGVYELFFPFVTYGVTNAITISAGTPIIPEAIGQVFYVAPKVTFVQTETMALAAGALYGSDGEDGGGIFYGVGTFGNPDRAVTVGVGWGFSHEDVASQALLNVGGELRVSPRVKLLSENYMIQDVDGALVSGGVRFFGERLSADLGIGTVIGVDCDQCFLPLVNFVYSF